MSATSPRVIERRAGRDLIERRARNTRQRPKEARLTALDRPAAGCARAEAAARPALSDPLFDGYPRDEPPRRVRRRPPAAKTCLIAHASSASWQGMAAVLRSTVVLVRTLSESACSPLMMTWLHPLGSSSSLKTPSTTSFLAMIALSKRVCSLVGAFAKSARVRSGLL